MSPVLENTFECPEEEEKKKKEAAVEEEEEEKKETEKEAALGGNGLPAWAASRFGRFCVLFPWRVVFERSVGT